MSNKTIKVEMTCLDSNKVKMNTRHIIYVEKDYDERLNLYIQSHYDEIRSYFQEKGFVFCYLPRMTEEDMQDIIPKSIVELISMPFKCITFRSSYVFDCLKERGNMEYPALLFCTSNPEKPNSSLSVYRLLTLDMWSQWYVKPDFSNLLDDIRYYLKYHPDLPYDSEKELEELCCDPDFLNSLPEPDFDNYDEEEAEKELALDYEEGSLRNEIAQLRETTMKSVNRLNELGHDSIYKYDLVRSYDEDAGFPFLYVNKDLSIVISDVEEDFVLDLDAIHKAIYLLFLHHPEGIRYSNCSDYREELILIYKKLKPSYKGSGAGQRTIDNLLNFEEEGYLKNLSQKISRIKKEITKTLGNSKIAKGYVIHEEGEDLRLVTIAQIGGVVWYE